jgi:hypothetical protein
MSAVVCPYCRTALEESAAAESQPMVCEGCGTPHHADCFAENGGCTVFGCRCAPQDEPKVSISPGDVSAVEHAPLGAVAPQPAAPPPPPPPPGLAAAHPAFLDAAYAQTRSLRQEPYAVGEKVVIPVGTHLPARCLKCGLTPIGPWISKTVSWHATWVYILLLSPIIYILVAALVRKKMAVELPLCEEHQQERRRRMWWGWILFFAWLPLLIVANLIDSENATIWAALLGVVCGIAGLLFLSRVSIIQPTRITPEFCEFKGASPEFRSYLAPAPMGGARG